MPERTIQPPRRPAGHAGWFVGAALVGVSIAFVALTHMEPGYDAYGWLVWGRQTLHWNLDTNGAPSWKPLTFLFTLPYAPLGRTQPWLWMVIDVADAGRLRVRRPDRLPAHRAHPGRRYAPYVAGAFAGLALLGIDDYWHQIVIANSDQIDVTLCLAAIDCHLGRRPRLAFGALVLASLGRPEAWPFAALYAIWLWRTCRAPGSWPSSDSRRSRCCGSGSRH